MLALPHHRRPASAAIPSRAVPVSLRDGTALALRPLGPGDRTAMRAFLEALSPRSRRLRFGAPMPRVRGDVVERLCATDGGAHVAWGAWSGDRLVGCGRFFRLPDHGDAAEAGLTVADALQRRGLGGVLLEAVAISARARGIARLGCQAAGSNDAVLALLRSLGGEVRIRAGEAEGSVSVAAAIRGRVDAAALLRADAAPAALPRAA